MTGIELIAEERRRQVAEEGWSEAHDDTHTAGDLRVHAAICCCDGTDAHVEDPLDRDWGLTDKHGYRGTKPDQIHLLAIAGALIAAEIDRLQRAS